MVSQFELWSLYKKDLGTIPGHLLLIVSIDICHVTILLKFRSVKHVSIVAKGLANGVGFHAIFSKFFGLILVLVVQIVPLKLTSLVL